jgi:hypothetical protein
MTDQPLANAVECAIGLNVDCGGTQGVHRVRDAVLAALEEHLDIGEAEAWCKTCRRVWDGKQHRCEGTAEAALARIEALAEEYPVGIDTALIHEALAHAEQPARTTPNNPTTSNNQP